MGSQVPEVISERIFSLFATSYTSEAIAKQQEMLASRGQVPLRGVDDMTIGNQTLIGGLQANGMTFEDLLACYIVFRCQKQEEIADLTYEMIKLSKDQPYIGRDDLMHFCKRIGQFDDNFVNVFYKRTQLDPRIPIMKDQFIELYPKFSFLQMFQLIPEVTSGFKKDYLQLEAGSDKVRYNK